MSYYTEHSPTPYQEQPRQQEPREPRHHKLPKIRAALIGFVVGIAGISISEGVNGTIDTIPAIAHAVGFDGSGDRQGSADTAEGTGVNDEAAGDSGPISAVPEASSNHSAHADEPKPTPVAQAAAEAKTILAVGDICKPGRGCMPMGGVVKKQMGSSEGLDNFLVLGDSQYDTGDYGSFMRYYDKALGAKEIKDITIPTIGNHEMKSGGSGYYKYFFGGKNTPYHAHQIGSWLVVAVNSEIATGPGSAQSDWLKKTLEGSDAKCKLVFQHKPRWSVGTHGSDPNMSNLFKIMHEGGVDIDLAGHDHNYQRYKTLDGNGNLEKDGIRTWVVGTGGAENYPLGNSRALDAKFNGVTGGLKLTLEDGSYKTTFVGTNGTRDSISGTCDNNR